MVPFLFAEAVRRARRRIDPTRRTYPRTPVRVLLIGEVRHLAGLPATAVLASGAVAATAVHVALGHVYPGPVAADGLRALLVAVVVVATVGLARALPPTWSAVVAGLPGLRMAVGGVVAAGLVGLVKVGLHDTTPGPVLGSPWRWPLVLLVVLGVFVALRRRVRP